MGGKALYIALHSSHPCNDTSGTQTAGDAQVGFMQAPVRHRQHKPSILQWSCAASQPDRARCSHHRHLYTHRRPASKLSSSSEEPGSSGCPLQQPQAPYRHKANPFPFLAFCNTPKQPCSRQSLVQVQPMSVGQQAAGNHETLLLIPSSMQQRMICSPFTTCKQRHEHRCNDAATAGDRHSGLASQS